MKEKFLKFLRFTRLDVLLLGLIEKLARQLVKKLTALHEKALNALEKRKELFNGEKESGA